MNSICKTKEKTNNDGVGLSKDMESFIDHVADLLADEFVKAMKDEGNEDESSNLRKV